MKFAAKTEIAAPQQFAFDQLSDFARFEEAIRARGAQLQRQPAEQGLLGTRWDGEVAFRGRHREVGAELTQWDPPAGYGLSVDSGGFVGDFVLALRPLDAARCALSVELVLEPTSMSARLMLQSLKLARGNLERRFSDRVQAQGQEIAAAWRAKGARGRRPSPAPPRSGAGRRGRRPSAAGDR
ncbi:SRPBCC family protein [Pseudoroseicyclus aestuarii]|uniref:Polyketide cyclase/dehydrase/lipid transport protein n=1 Tax=Pseudoroseicyclus aestuarii TaxID=1795041 RepID=A0A318SUA9_9RHOB|nr:SRPBCC family protein [Pseudoroseicyclus aestuarii]PYE83959.1 hypothetical protein DFP88_103321 [Pseudoroseicyclus aestuarii]